MLPEFTIPSLLAQVDHPSIEADSQGEDIEDVEFNREKESSDEETSSIREFRDDSSQPSIAPVSEYARMDAELGHSNTEPEVRFEGGRRRAKRVGNEQSGESQPRRRRRRQVIMSSLSSSEAGAEAEANESGSEGAERSATSSEWGDLRNDDDPTWDGNDERDSEELREFFSVCRIDPRSGRDRREFLAPQVCPLSMVDCLSVSVFPFALQIFVDARPEQTVQFVQKCTVTNIRPSSCTFSDNHDII